MRERRALANTASLLKSGHGHIPSTSGHFTSAKLVRRTKQKQQSVPRSFCSRLTWDTYQHKLLIYIDKLGFSKSLVGPEGLTSPARCRLCGGRNRR